MALTKLEKKYPSMDFGDEFYGAKKNLNALNESFSEFKTMVEDPDYYINEYFLDLRNQVDLDRELSKKQIDDHYDGLIKELALFEKEYKSKKNNEKHEGLIKKFEADLERLNIGLNVPKLDVTKWKNINNESIGIISVVNSTMKNHKIDLLRDRTFSFRPIQIELQSLLDQRHIFAQRMTTPIIKNETQSSGYFSCKFTNFDKNFRNRSEIYQLIDTKWYTCYQIVGNNFGFFLCLQNAMDFDYVEATIELGLIGEKNETKKSEKKLFSDQSSIHGCHNFMCLKEIVEERYFDRVNNTIHCNIKITINDFKMRVKSNLLQRVRSNILDKSNFSISITRRK